MFWKRYSKEVREIAERVRQELQVPRPHIEKQQFENQDLGCQDFSNAWIEGCVFKDVNFDRADLSKISDIANQFENCSFRDTKFQHAHLGYDGTRYYRCTFVEARMRNADAIRAEFDECKFISCDLKGVDFNASSFVDCRFEGKLEDVWFRGGFALPSDEKRFGKSRKNRMERVDYSAATLWDITFSNDCDLSTVVLPTDGQHKRYDNWKVRLEKAATIFACWPDGDDKNDAILFTKAYLIHAATQSWYILNRADLVEECGPKLADQILAALEA